MTTMSHRLTVLQKTGRFGDGFARVNLCRHGTRQPASLEHDMRRSEVSMESKLSPSQSGPCWSSCVAAAPSCSSR